MRADIALLFLHQIGTLNEHTAGTAAGIIEGAVKRLDQGGDQLNGIMGCIEFAFLLGCINRKFLQEVFVYPADQVFLFSECLVADLIDLIHDPLDIIGGKIAGYKCTLNEASLQPLAAGGQTVQSSIQRNIQLRCGGVNDGRPTGLHGQIVGAIRKGGIIEECCKNFFIIGIKPLAIRSCRSF